MPSAPAIGRAAFFAHVGSHRGLKYLHWNMRDINYGFAAIEHRHRVLGGSPVIVDDDKKIDLARLLIDIYGVGYVGLDVVLKDWVIDTNETPC
jgi:hypothetical protein